MRFRLFLVLSAVNVTIVPAVEAATFRGRTSQGTRVEVALNKHHALTSLTVRFVVRCTDHHTRSFTSTFERQFIHSRSGGSFSGTVDGFAGSFFSGPSYGEHLTFSARVTSERVTGTAQGTYTLQDSGGAVCKSPRVHFQVPTWPAARLAPA